MVKKISAVLGTGLLALALPSMGHVHAMSNMVTLKAHLSGMSEVGKMGPKNGKGTAKIVIYMNRHQLCYNLRVTGIGPAVAAHIHAGKAGKTGPVLVPFTKVPGASGKAAACVMVKPSILMNIANHPSSYYVNVHTAAYPDGAVRGQLM